MTLLIDPETSRQLLTVDDFLDAMDAVLKEGARGAAVNRRAEFHTQVGDDQWHRLRVTDAALEDQQVVSVRINSQRLTFSMVDGRPRQDWYAGEPGKFCGLILLFSAQTGEPLAIFNDAYIQHMRVGCTSMLGARYMSREDSSVLGILGSGGMAHSHATAAVKVRPIRQILVFSPNKEHREHFAAEMTDELGVDVQPRANPEDVVRAADIVATCTDSLAPVLEADWIQPGTHLSSVTGGMELGEDTFKRVSRLTAYLPNIHDHLIASKDGNEPRSTGGAPRKGSHGGMDRHAPEEARIDWKDLVLGKVPGRTSPDEITYFWGTGTGDAFGALAHRAYLTAKDRGLGREIPTDWFLETERD